MGKVQVLVVLALLTGSGFALDFPGKNPGSPNATEKDGRLTLSNDAISVSWTCKDGRLSPETIQNTLHSQTCSKLGDALFRLKISEAGGPKKSVASPEMEVVKGTPR